jgi:hypothetical protein
MQLKVGKVYSSPSVYTDKGCTLRQQIFGCSGTMVRDYKLEAPFLVLRANRKSYRIIPTWGEMGIINVIADSLPKDLKVEDDETHDQKAYIVRALEQQVMYTQQQINEVKAVMPERKPVPVKSPRAKR